MHHWFFYSYIQKTWSVRVSSSNFNPETATPPNCNASTRAALSQSLEGQLTNKLTFENDIRAYFWEWLVENDFWFKADIRERLVEKNLEIILDLPFGFPINTIISLSLVENDRLQRLFENAIVQGHSQKNLRVSMTFYSGYARIWMPLYISTILDICIIYRYTRDRYYLSIIYSKRVLSIDLVSRLVFFLYSIYVLSIDNTLFWYSKYVLPIFLYSIYVLSIYLYSI